MKHLFLILSFFTLNSSCSKEVIVEMNSDPAHKTITYLAIGDSYTIGESIPSAENFPNQTAALLQNDSIKLVTRIIARTGWTTDELEAGITNANNLDPLKSSYDMVTLLIGVNNQYRGRPVESYKPDFERLLNKAIWYAGNRPERVVVVSIPDWGVTPFASGRDRVQIAREIDAYNAANREISERYHIYYIDITGWTREAATDNSLLALDGLHPSGKEYARWAGNLAVYFKSKI